MQCVATVRGALQQVPGVEEVMIRASVKQFTVAYDPARTDVDAILAALEAAGEPARRR